MKVEVTFTEYERVKDNAEQTLKKLNEAKTSLSELIEGV
jgi:hypothetical protein